MATWYKNFRARMLVRGIWPASRLAWVAFYILALDVLFELLNLASQAFRWTWLEGLGGWVGLLTTVSFVLFTILAYRWLKARMLWRLRNRLIVTYVFIGVIPVVLLATLTLGTFYLFSGQFATYIVTVGLGSELKSLQAANTAIAQEAAAVFRGGALSLPSSFEGLRRTDKAWSDRQLAIWHNRKLVLDSHPENAGALPPSLPDFLKPPFEGVVRDHDRLLLRVASRVPAAGGELIVVASEPLDQHLLELLATKLGEVTLYASVNLSKLEQGGPNSAKRGVNISMAPPSEGGGNRGEYVLDTGNRGVSPTYTVGSVPPPRRLLDRTVNFATSVSVVDWQTGDILRPAAFSVQTRLSTLWDRLFEALGDFAPAVEYGLLAVAIFFALIELLALLIGTRLTRSITRAVAQLYQATQHVNRADFSHRIPVTAKDQLAELANSFNSMTGSIERLIIDQKEKHRLENELSIAQEVQAQLFPKEIYQLESLEVHGFCRPARTVSGDYYDFLTVNADKLILAVGDISGKGISAALLMATIHSAVRAYSLENLPMLREAMLVGAAPGSSVMLAEGAAKPDISPASLLALLNHQLYESTPPEKYATLFLGMYDARTSVMRYSNGGHLPPLLVSPDGGVRRLTCGGSVVALFDNLTYDEDSVQLNSGDIFLAYSDGVTEPENDFGEFGEDRLLELVRENRHLPLIQITDIVTQAVDDWIGPNEQPDDVTLVLARAR